ncbi:methyltransferase domain-containing protein, partial [Candidatus Bathyarchaeota archaeon]|nr:methyltransferase domain-containing protein [Candidatus Bathyarchaeota archaeon]
MNGKKSRENSYPGGIEPSFLDRLARFWPCPREQLHFGGWQATRQLMTRLQVDTASHILDICCGEGGTACWLAQSLELRVDGVDILEKAIETARARAKRMNVSDLARFTVANVFDLPFPDRTFDLIYGQDPDGLAHQDRKKIFRECRRVLEPGCLLGFQHWIAGDDMPPNVYERFERITSAGYPFMKHLRVGDYKRDLLAAGFSQIEITSLRDLYHEHVVKMRDISRKRDAK